MSAFTTEWVNNWMTDWMNVRVTMSFITPAYSYIHTYTETGRPSLSDFERVVRGSRDDKVRVEGCHVTVFRYVTSSRGREILMARIKAKLSGVWAPPWQVARLACIIESLNDVPTRVLRITDLTSCHSATPIRYPQDFRSTICHGDTSIGVPPPENVSVTFIFEPMTFVT